MKRVLIVDDDKAISEVLSMLLSDAGYEVAAVVSADEVFKVVAKDSSRPDFILMDMLLSGSNGATIARKLKADEKAASIPLVLMSANPHAEEESRSVGADAFLAKPFDIDEVLSLVEKFTS